MRYWTMAAVPLALAMTLTACNASVSGGGKEQAGETRDAGPVTTQDFALTGFTGVEVTGPDDVTIRQGTAFSISATGPKAEIDELEVRLDGQTLSIGRKREGFNFRRGGKGVKIAITMPRLDRLRLTGSGSIDADAVEGDAVEAALTGSGDLKIAKLTGKTAKISVSGSGDVEIDGGSADSAELSVTGSGDIDASDLTVATIDVAVTGSGDVAAKATGKADISILGSGDVELTGGATCSTSRMGSGTATCK
ncbi:MAG TPA: head GIN domain-containing protein [Sphingopyxis sp.]|nr:head GIN domain-containing protein [Sphingopyxis sp.]HMQ20639.1 head GIN domain-containing protein [Sphingopyxis sp.]